MRYSFSEAFGKIAKRDKKIVFLTGDLGFNAFEGLQKELGLRFINAGVAEHNMVTAAAGLAYAGFKPWIYSIAPFVSIKVLEEIRNDICLTGANVKIVGLGGGYDYAIAGPTHHATEDVGAILTLPNIKVYAPGFYQDVETVVKKIYEEDGPAYLRLTRAEETGIEVPAFRAFRRLKSGNKITVIALGSIINKVVEACSRFKSGLDLWVVSEIPFELKGGLEASIKRNKIVCIVEEHRATGGLGQYLARQLALKNIKLNKFIHLYARGYTSKKYGSRDFYLKESGLDSESIADSLRSLL